MPELVEAAGPDPADAQAQCNAVAKAIDRCVSLGRFDDALRLSDWLVARFVPRGNALSWRIVMGASAMCADLGRDANLNMRAIRSLRRTVAAVPRGGSNELELALCGALTNLGALHTQGRTARTWRRRTRRSIKVFDAVITRWSRSKDDWLRMNVAGAMLNKAQSLLELGDEAAARREYARVVESFPADTWRGSEAEAQFGARLLVARHALEILDSMRLPEPEFNTGYIDAVRRRKRREMRQTPLAWLLRWLFMPGTRVDARRYLDAARRLHHRTADFVRYATCVAEPWVLVLRNFELTLTTFVRDSSYEKFAFDDDPDPIQDDGPEHIQVATTSVGLRVMNKLFEATNVVQVANTKSAALDLPTKTTEFLGHGRVPRLLYLPNAGWLDTVRVLIGLAERVVIWAGAKSPALLQELALVTELGRTDDAVVLLDEMPHFYVAFPDAPLPGEALTADDPALAGFPTVLEAQEVSADPDPFLRDMASAITAAQQRPMAERVALIRQRMGWLDRQS